MASRNKRKNARRNYNNNYNRTSKSSRTSRDTRDTAVKFNKHARIFGLAFILIIFMFTLIFRIGWLQFVQGASLKEAATKQQTTSRIISPNRGSIYDSTGKPLAISAAVDQ